MTSILHVTHTDIFNDARINKEIDALQEVPQFSVYGLGISGHNQKSFCKNLDNLHLALAPKASQGKAVRTFLVPLSFIEMFFKHLIFFISRKPDIIHCHDFICFLSCIFGKMILGCRLVYDAHELESDKNGSSWIGSIITKTFEKIFWRDVDLFITVSQRINDWYRKNYGTVNSIIILNSPSVDERYAENNRLNYLREKFRISESRLVFIYVGFFAEGRGIRLLLDLFGVDFSAADIVFLGYGPLETEIARIEGECSNIHLHEQVEHTAVTRIVRSANYGLCFIEPVSLSDYFCLPNKLFEYAFSGTYVIASKFPEIETVVSKHRLGVCCDASIESMRECIAGILATKPASSSCDLEDLSWEFQSKKLKEGYLGLVSIEV